VIPKWVDKRYDVLWEIFSASTFRFEDAVAALKDKIDESEDQVNTVLSELKRAGALKVDFDPIDARKRIYTLLSKEQVISSQLALTRGGLEGLLKAAADLIRTRVDYSFILLLLFYKRVSDKWELEFEEACKEAIADGLSAEEARLEAKNSLYHDFDISEELLWDAIRKDPARLPETFSVAMKALADRNPELKDVFENVDFVQFTSNRENAEILRQLVELFSSQSLQHVAPDMLGDAYEWILRFFAPQKAKEGEVYTAREVIKLLIEILDPKPGESVYDPACGSGGMLICAYQHVEHEMSREKANKLFLYGQEANHKTLALAKMNLFIHDIRNAQLGLGDTLLYPKFKDGDGVRKFDVVIANPPWNLDGFDETVIKKGEFWRERFAYGFSSRQSADWAWVQHMLASADDNTGRVGIVIDNGCLFRGGKEKAIRTAVLNDDLLEAVILLPEKLFYNTGAPGAVLIFNKRKPDDRKKKVLLVNASSEYQQHPDVRKLNKLGDENIANIAQTCSKFTERAGFSRIVEIAEIRENDDNLNVTLYVSPVEVVEEIDIQKEWEELQQTEKELSNISEKVDSYLKELKYQ
jgi:type I restriction enzyme M protein